MTSVKKTMAMWWRQARVRLVQRQRYDLERDKALHQLEIMIATASSRGPEAGPARPIDGPLLLLYMHSFSVP